MPRQRTGTLVTPTKPGQPYRAQVTVDVPVSDKYPTGKRRETYSLETEDPAIAKRKLKKLVRALAKGADGTEAATVAGAAETVGEFAKRWIGKREDLGVRFAADERRWLESVALPSLGSRPLDSVRPAAVRAVLEEAVSDGYSRQSLIHVRGTLRRMFDAAWKDELIQENPVLRVDVPSVREVKKERVILADEEITRFALCAEIDAEIRVLGVCSRMLGGMRTGDLNAWDWSAFDRQAFAEVAIPRAKTRHDRPPQILTAPEPLRPVLRGWWEKHGSPEAGPVFPCRRGANKDGFKRNMNSYAKRLRRALLKAGIKRHECIRPGDAPPLRFDEPCCANMAGTRSTTRLR